MPDESYRKPAPAPVVELGPLPFRGQILFAMMPFLMVAICITGAVVMRVLIPAETHSTLRCTREGDELACTYSLEGTVTQHYRGKRDEVRLSEHSSRSGKYTCVDVGGRSVECDRSAPATKARLEALAPGEEAVFPHVAKRGYFMDGMAVFATLVFGTMGISVLRGVRDRRRVRRLTVTAKALEGATGTVARVPDERVRVERRPSMTGNLLPRHALVYGSDAGWATLSEWRCGEAELAPVANAVRAALESVPRA